MNKAIWWIKEKNAPTTPASLTINANQVLKIISLLTPAFKLGVVYMVRKSGFSPKMLSP